MSNRKKALMASTASAILLWKNRDKLRSLLSVLRGRHGYDQDPEEDYLDRPPYVADPDDPDDQGYPIHDDHGYRVAENGYYIDFDE